MYFKQRQPVLIESGHPVYTCVYMCIQTDRLASAVFGWRKSVVTWANCTLNDK